jgi:hypothetical protein
MLGRMLVEVACPVILDPAGLAAAGEVDGAPPPVLAAEGEEVIIGNPSGPVGGFAPAVLAVGS